MCIQRWWCQDEKTHWKGIAPGGKWLVGEDVFQVNWNVIFSKRFSEAHPQVTWIPCSFNSLVWGLSSGYGSNSMMARISHHPNTADGTNWRRKEGRNNRLSSASLFWALAKWCLGEPLPPASCSCPASSGPCTALSRGGEMQMEGVWPPFELSDDGLHATFPP